MCFRFMIQLLVIPLLIIQLTAVNVCAHIIPPENFHPVAQSYRRINFFLNLNPIDWKTVKMDVMTIGDHLEMISPADALSYQTELAALLDQTMSVEAPINTKQRHEIARHIFESSTRTVAYIIVLHLLRCMELLSDYSQVTVELREARQIWASFEHEVKSTDTKAFVNLGRSWLKLSGSIGNPGILNVGAVEPDLKTFEETSKKIISYINENFGDEFKASNNNFQPLPTNSKTFQANANVMAKLPPGNNINKQVPRPRQILNMVARGVDESETALIAFGDMAFDSTFIFGEPARSLSMTCNTCHNKAVTNKNFFIPGLSSVNGGMDVSNAFFAPHANNGVFDPLDIPDLRGIRFTAPYGRNGRITSLREFIRNVIMHEFNGAEPDPLVLDAMIAYMNEFDFLPNPKLNADGTLNDQASASAKRGEKLFNTKYKGMGNRSCAMCHIPSNNFLDRRNHDIGSVNGAEPFSRDRSMDTPTLLSINYSGPYFHDGSQPTIKDVTEWFNTNFNLKLNEKEKDDLTAYVETVGDGTDGYEATSQYLDAEMKEFSFFLSAYEYLKEQNKPELITITFQTIAQEINNHKWELQDDAYLPIMNQLAQIMHDAIEANMKNDSKKVDALVAEYRKLYDENVEILK